MLKKARETYLELGQNYSRLVQIKREKISCEMVFEGEGINNLKKAVDSVVSELKRLKSINIILTQSEVFFRSYRIPGSARDRIEEMIELRLSTDLPLEKKDFIYSIFTHKTGKNELQVLTFTSKKGLIEEIYNSFNGRNIRVKSILPGGLIYYLIHRDKEDLTPGIYLDKDSHQGHITFFNGKKIYLKSIRLDGNFKKELKRNINLFINSLGSERVNLVINNKRVGTLNGTIDITDLSLFNNIEDDDHTLSKWEKVFLYKKDLIKANLLTEVTSDKRRQRNISGVWFLIIIIILLNAYGFYVRYNNDVKYLATLKGAAEDLKPLLNEINTVKTEYNHVVGEIKKLEAELQGNYRGYLPWLRELGGILPEGTVIEEVSFKDNKLVALSGSSPSATAVMENLEKSEYFTRLRFEGSITRENGKERFRIAGEISNGLN
ncbi:PilN domain-containing protein [Halothermothrix orenii]|uniref:Fimbrial assembly family protein n=1 Tax=Halothermothrix orenii (strain H 168 / OCM 544 / DSM 9562) TaxID=373903 RepID=B8CZ94_HALOH|nr:PilN domain-containing protein [Halothermothrix orenii]ACL70613.1 Fimbrial assembly family protein [Halothermothrix orenii H 168]